MFSPVSYLFTPSHWICTLIFHTFHKYTFITPWKPANQTPKMPTKKFNSPQQKVQQKNPLPMVDLQCCQNALVEFEDPPPHVLARSRGWRLLFLLGKKNMEVYGSALKKYISYCKVLHKYYKLIEYIYVQINHQGISG